MIKLLAEEDLKELFSGKRVEGIGDDNYLTVPDLRQKVLPKLTKDEQQLLDGGVAALELAEKDPETPPGSVISGHRGHLRQMLVDEETFAVQGSYDGTKPPPPLSYTYPLALELESALLPPPNQNAEGSPYTVAVEYLRRGTAGESTTIYTDELKLAQSKFDEKVHQGKKYVRLMLKVPAGADALRLTSSSPNLLLARAEGEPSDGGEILLKGLLPSRLRAARLEHFNEWSPGGAAVFDTLKKMKVLPESFATSKMLPLTWWHPDGAVRADRANLSDFDAAAPDVEYCGFVLPPSWGTKAVSRSGSLFGKGDDQLPVDAHIDNLHPVTVLCLLEMLTLRGKLKVTNTWDRLRFQKAAPPFAWGFISEKEPSALVLGDRVQAMVVDDDRGYDLSQRVKLQLRIGKDKPVLVDEAAYEPNGFILRPLRIDFWGDWKLLVEGAEDPTQVLGTTTLSIAAPQLEAPTEEEAKLGLFKPKELHSHWVVPIKLKHAEPPVKELGGVVGVELQDASGNWKDAELPHEGSPQRVFIPSVASGTAAGEELAIDEKQFIVEGGFVTGLTTEGRSSAKVHGFSPQLAYESLRRAQAKAPVAVSLVDAVQRLRDNLGGGLGIAVTELGRDGKRCVLVQAKAAYRLAHLATQDAAFVAVRVPGGSAKLPKLPEHPTDKELEKKLTALGVEVEIARLETKDALLAMPDCPLKQQPKGRVLDPGSLTMSDDGLFITGASTAKAGGYVTAGFTLREYTDVSALRVSRHLVTGLVQLCEKAKCTITSLDSSGTFCKVEGKGAIEAARAIPHFAHVEGKDGKPEAALQVAGAGVLYATFDPQPVLDALFTELDKKGGAPTKTPYRFYFRAVNGLSLYRKWTNVLENTRRHIFADEVEPLGQEESPGLVFQGTPKGENCGTLRKLAFEPLRFELIEKQVHVTCQLRGNRTAWAPFQVRITRLTGGEKEPSRTFDVQCGDQLIHGTFDIPQTAKEKQSFKIEALLPAKTEQPEHAPPPERQDDCEFKPELGTLAVHASGEYLLVVCETTGLEAPGQDRPAPEPSAPLTAKQVEGIHPTPKGSARALSVEVSLDGKRCENRVHYLLPTVDAKGRVRGMVNHQGTFCAFVAVRGLKVGTAYALTVKHDGAVREAPVTAAETTYTHEE